MAEDNKRYIVSISKEGKEECLSVAIDNRKLEIELLWKRTTIFWGFIAALFIAVATAIDKSRQLSFVLSTLGLVFSLIWTSANRGSKAWQESWEIKADYYFNELYPNENTKNIYERVYDKEKDGKVFFLLRPGPYSLSRLLIALSDFSCIFWLGLCLYLFPYDFVSKLPVINLKEDAGTLFFAFGVAYCLYVLKACKSESESKDKSERFTKGPRA